MADPDYIVDIAGLEGAKGALAASAELAEQRRQSGVGSLTGRPWLAVHWTCCQTYSRIYRNRAGAAYEGRCPTCGGAVRATVGPDGTSARFFTAG